MADIKITYWWRFHVRSRRGPGALSAIAWLLRRAATVIDGKQSISIDAQSTPCISQDEQSEIINRGMRLSGQMFVEEVRREAIEQAMRENLPELYGEELCKTKS